ncbi:U3 small nucleolar RNA-associated protein 25-like isoform X2 [Rhodamnia argentea]|uniref:U3 small nucleolar RNA-associated protein 25-like isoform X2 n=1 Tax=Rhodamnia argentea TaxID=178133 RepID=A0ABM3HCL5_9MYRT|nr:U3 small nucleolar RNA-associated protein 25-like isoform X2 [Rhodamnia argentea]XP_048134347.1 U3 small nucleolar RNA-associated protein 25-like isoform X2 [Rhodamnia argentea]
MAKRNRQKHGFKNPKTPEISEDGEIVRKKHKVEEHTSQRISPDPAELSNVDSDDEAVFKEPSAYDNLLVTLGSGGKYFSDAYRRRQREEEGKSDSEENEYDDSDSLGGSGWDDSERGSDDESPKIDARESIIEKFGVVVAGEEGEVAEMENDRDTSESEQEHESQVHSNGAVEASECVRNNIASVCTQVNAIIKSSPCHSYSMHLGHQISKGEIDELSKKRWKYKWEVSAAENCKWVGTGESFIRDDNLKPGYGLKPSLYRHWLNIYETSEGSDFHTSKERLFFSLCDSYRDILNCSKRPFYHKGHGEDSSTMDAYIMHSLNHIFRTRDLVTQNDTKMAKHKETANDEILSGGGFLDHGFTRPKVLILLPLRNIAFRVVKRLIQLTPSNHKVNVEYLGRFSDDFGAGEAHDNEDDEVFQDVRGSGQKSSKPTDFRALFDGNPDDHFMVGIKFTRKSMKLYSDFYTSDMIVASPLGLITKIGEAEREKDKDVDYLSSIEILIIDHADIIAMQNWSHVNTVVEQLNCLPSKQHGMDVMRMRQWYLDGYARFYRQSIVLGYFLNPDMNALFNQHCLNYEGKVKLVCEYKGVLPKVLIQARQIYERFDADSISEADDARLEYFTKKVFPKIKDSIQGGIMLFISSYFEFVRIRNFLKSQNASFCLLGEYTKQSDISRSRVWFFEGRKKIMLYTERAHFYHRYKIRGIQNLIIYSLPERKELYPEIVNMLEGSHGMTSTVLFSRFDQLRLERIVGSTAAKRMITSEKSVFAFC